MYLNRVPKVNSNEELDEMTKGEGSFSDQDEYETHEDYVKHLREKLPTLNEERHVEKSDYFKIGWLGKEVAYWRKANAIHRWFVENAQNNKDECLPHLVSKEKLEELLLLAYEVKDHQVPNKLPSQEGFFFGSTDYDELYYQDIDLTIDQLEKVLSETDWEKDSIYYQSSW